MLTCKTTKAEHYRAAESSWNTQSTASSTGSGANTTDTASFTAAETQNGTNAGPYFVDQTTYKRTSSHRTFINGVDGSTAHSTAIAITSTSSTRMGSSFSWSSRGESQDTVSYTTGTDVSPFTTTGSSQGTTIVGSGSFSGTLAAQTISFGTTSTETFTSRITGTGANGKVSYTTTGTNGTTTKTTVVSTSNQASKTQSAFSTVTLTRHASASSSIAQPTFAGSSAAYNVTTTAVAVFADRDEMLYSMTLTGAAVSGLPSQLLTASVSSLIEPARTETYAINATGFDTVASTINSVSVAGTVTFTRQSTIPKTVRRTFSWVTDAASTRFRNVSIYSSSTYSSQDWSTYDVTTTHAPGFLATNHARGNLTGVSESFLGIYNESTAFDPRQSTWSYTRRGQFDRSTVGSPPSQFTDTANIVSASISVTSTREAAAADGVSLRLPTTQATETLMAWHVPKAGEQVFGFVAHPASRATTDAPYWRLTGDTRNFSATWRAYASIQRGVAIPALNKPHATGSTTVSYDSAANSVHETAGAATDDYVLTAANSDDMALATYVRTNTNSWSNHPVSNLGGVNYGGLPVVMSVRAGQAYTLRDTSGGTTSSHVLGETVEGARSMVSVADGLEILLSPKAYWTRTQEGDGYTSARIEI